MSWAGALSPSSLRLIRQRRRATPSPDSSSNTGAASKRHHHGLARPSHLGSLATVPAKIGCVQPDAGEVRQVDQHLFGLGLGAWHQAQGGVRWVVVAAVPLLAAALWGMFNVVDDPSRSGQAPVEVPGWIRLTIELLVLCGGCAAYGIAWPTVRHRIGPGVGRPEPDRGVVAVGPVGMAWLGRWQLFR